MNLRILLGGTFWVVGLICCGAEGPNVINFVGLGIFGVGCLLVAKGCTALKIAKKYSAKYKLRS